MVDALDKIFDMQYIREELVLRIERGGESRQPITLVAFGLPDVGPRGGCFDEVTLALKSAVRTTDVLCRFPGGFMLLVPDDDQECTPHLIARAFRAVHLQTGQALHASVTRWPRDAGSVENMLYVAVASLDPSVRSAHVLDARAV